MIKQRDTYKFCTNCKAALVERAGFKSCPDCQKHYYFNANPTVTVVLFNKDGDILLTSRAFAPFKDWWDLPGGFVEEDETFEEAAHRELTEETGLAIKDVQYLGSFSEGYEYRDEVVSVVAAVFSATVDGDDAVVVADDVSGYKFVPVKELDVDSIAFDNQREFFRAFLARRGYSLEMH